MPVIHPDELHRYVRTVCAALGSDERETGLVADQLVGANLAGHDSHGVGMVPAYVHGATEGQLHVNVRPEFVVDHGALAVLDGNQGFGQVNGYEAMAIAIERAGEHGVAVVGLRNTFHLGRIGHWGEQCAAAGLASIHFVNVATSRAVVAPYGGREPRFVTNPVCIAVPGTDGSPLAMLDMATSTIALGKARVALEEGRPVPDGSVIDESGRLTNDPSGLFCDPPAGALVAMGDHKGSGLAIMAELVGAALIGGPVMHDQADRSPGRIINNMLSIVIDPATTGAADLASDAQAYLRHVASSAPRQGFSEVLLPGQPEQRARAARAEGVPVDDATLSLLRSCAADAGVAQPADWFSS